MEKFLKVKQAVGFGQVAFGLGRSWNYQQKSCLDIHLSYPLTKLILDIILIDPSLTFYQNVRILVLKNYMSHP